MFELLNNRRNGDDSYSVRPIEDNRPKNGKLQGLYRGIGKVLASVFLAAFFICSLENVNVFAAEAREELDAYKIIWGNNLSDEKTYFVPLSITNSLTIHNRVKVQGNITLDLTAGTALVIPQGIEVPQGSTLTITGTGKLDIPRASDGNAGIGSNNNADGGIIKILNGLIMVDATGSEAAAAIGSSKEHKLEEINIAGGTIKAKGGVGGVGIGSGINAGFSKIIISGGYIDAEGGQNGCGIGGCGTSDNDDSVIMISGENTQVMAKGCGAPGIGIREGHLNLLSISGGEVNATTYSSGNINHGSAAIGCGGNMSSNLKIDKIEISGGKVYADALNINGAGIGLGLNTTNFSHCIQEINITGGEIKASGWDSTSIGCRKDSSDKIGKINISGGDIIAECLYGNYWDGRCLCIGGIVEEINISGGKIKATSVDDNISEIAAHLNGSSVPQINISGGYVKADKIEAKNNGKISTTGNAIIDSGNMTGFDENNPRCIWLKGENYKDSRVYGDVSTTTDAELPEVDSTQAKLLVPNNASLKIGRGTTFTVNRRFTLKNESTITVEGTLIIKSGAKLDNSHGKIILNGGDIQIENGAEVVKAGKYTGNIPKPTAKRTESGLIELNAIAVPRGAQGKIEYAYKPAEDDTRPENLTNWQSSNIFNSLDADGKYVFYARLGDQLVEYAYSPASNVIKTQAESGTSGNSGTSGGNGSNVDDKKQKESGIKPHSDIEVKNITDVSEIGEGQNPQVNKKSGKDGQTGESTSITEYVYDNNTRVVETVYKDGRITVQIYDEHGNIIATYKGGYKESGYVLSNAASLLKDDSIKVYPFYKGYAVATRKRGRIKEYSLINKKAKPVVKWKRYHRLDALGSGYYAITVKPKNKKRIYTKVYKQNKKTLKQVFKYPDGYYKKLKLTINKSSYSNGFFTGKIDRRLDKGKLSRLTVISTKGKLYMIDNDRVSVKSKIFIGKDQKILVKSEKNKFFEVSLK